MIARSALARMDLCVPDAQRKVKYLVAERLWRCLANSTSCSSMCLRSCGGVPANETQVDDYCARFGALERIELRKVLVRGPLAGDPRNHGQQKHERAAQVRSRKAR